MRGLTTHVLDTTLGRPAGGLRIELFRLEPERRSLKSVTTNADGRCEAPLLAGDELRPGGYELVFHAGDYLRQHYPDLTEPLFLDQIPVRFAVAPEGGHYHVPLLLSPFAYSTYRGS